MNGCCGCAGGGGGSWWGGIEKATCGQRDAAWFSSGGGAREGRYELQRTNNVDDNIWMSNWRGGKISAWLPGWFNFHSRMSAAVQDILEDVLLRQESVSIFWSIGDTCGGGDMMLVAANSGEQIRVREYVVTLSFAVPRLIRVRECLRSSLGR